MKYSEPGGRIDVTLFCDEANAALTVRNTGPEIPATDLPFVFNRFYRGRQNHGSVTTGSGLGLSIAKWIVDNHGGWIDLVSADRQTTVTIHLPLAG